MSAENPNGDPTDGGIGSNQVLDEEGTVDEKLKSRIISVRELVDKREDLLFVVSAVDPGVDVDEREAVAAWGGTVRQYLRAIEPLLRAEDIESASYYYTEPPLGEVTLAPPNQDGYEFSKFADDRFDNQQLIREMGLPPNTTPPAPYREKYVGLRDAIEKTSVSHGWVVTVSDGVGPEREVADLQAEIPTPRYILENAVRKADQFLQQAGVGLEIGARETDATDDNPM
jgi:hypothetical protein